MAKIICLDKNYSTTQLLTKEMPDVNSQSKAFETVLFFLEKGEQKSEGDLHEKGYFKQSQNIHTFYQNIKKKVKIMRKI